MATGKVWTHHAAGIKSKVRKRDGQRIYYAEVWCNGKRCCEKAGTTERQAVKKLGTMQAAVDNGTYLPPAKRKLAEKIKQHERWSFERLLKRFERDYANRRKRPDWFVHKAKVTTRHKLTVGYVDEATRAKVEAYAAKRATMVKPRSVNGELAYLNTLFNTAVAWGIIAVNPAAGVKRMRVEATGHYFDAIEKQALLKAAREIEPEFLPLLQFQLLTGLRAGEAATLDWSQVDLEARRIRVVRTKTNVDRTVPLSKTAAAVLAGLPSRFAGGLVFIYKGKPIIEYHDKGRENRRYLAPWGRVKQAAAVQAGRLHDLRHTWASDFAMRNSNLFALQQIGGWESLEMVQKVYGHLTADYLATAADSMDGLLDISGDAVGDAVASGS